MKVRVNLFLNGGGIVTGLYTRELIFGHDVFFLNICRMRTIIGDY